jgi:integral membrane protein
MTKTLKIFRVIAFLEGLSYILLLFVAVPLKYFYGDPQYVKLLGMPHGLLFIAYIVMAIWFWNDFKWSKRILYLVLLAAIIPFGTFYIDKKYLKHD